MDVRRARSRWASRYALALATVAPILIITGVILGMVFEGQRYSSSYFGVATFAVAFCVALSAPAARVFEESQERRVDTPRGFLAYVRFHASAAELPPWTATVVLACYAPLVLFYVFLVLNMLVAFVT